MKVYNTLNVHERKLPKKAFKKPSQTVPDQTMSMRELLERHAKGLGLENAKTAIYEEEGQQSSGINPKTLDLVDIQEISMNNEERIKELKTKAETEWKTNRAEQLKREQEEAEFKQKVLAFNKENPNA